MKLSELVPFMKELPFQHQFDGILALARNKFFALFDEQGAGKTFQVLAAAGIKFLKGDLQGLIVVAPQNVVGGWTNEEWGEIHKHCFVNYKLYSFRGGKLTMIRKKEGLQRENLVPSSGLQQDNFMPTSGLQKDIVVTKDKFLHIVVTNYEQVRVKKYRKELVRLFSRLRVGVVLDESHYIKHFKSAQTKACVELGRRYLWRVAMTGTPRGNSVLDLFTQYDFLSPTIFKHTPTYFTFRNRYVQMGGFLGKQVVQENYIEEIQNLTKPYTLRRLKKDCLDLPAKLFTQREHRISANTWRMYCEMRDDLITTLEPLGDSKILTASNAAVKIMRLRMLAAGVFTYDVIPGEEEPKAQIIDHSKEEAVLAWLEELDYVPMIIWCEFRVQRASLAHRVRMLQKTEVVEIYGGQKESEKEHAKDLFSNPKHRGKKMTLVGQPQAGGTGLNLVNASFCAYASPNYSYINWSQSQDRLHRPGQTQNVLYNNFLACGPDGQRTIEHIILARLLYKESAAEFTARAWVQRLKEE